MLNLDSSFFDIEQAHKAMSIKDIAFQLRMGQQKLKRLLETVGFEYDATTKKWRYIVIDASTDLREFTVYQINSRQHLQHLQHLNDIASDVVDGNMLTIADIQFLKQFIAKQQDRPMMRLDEAKSIIKAIEGVSAGTTSKKKFKVHNDLIEQLDKFCDKMRIKKSDFLAIAIKDTLNKYR